MMPARVDCPRSSTQCELIALVLALRFEPAMILTDSLASLLMVSRWGCWPAQKTLDSADRVEVRRFLAEVGQLSSAPTLVKMKAHDEAAIRAGRPKAVGNDLADSWAKKAASEAGHPV